MECENFHCLRGLYDLACLTAKRKFKNFAGFYNRWIDRRRPVENMLIEKCDHGKRALSEERERGIVEYMDIVLGGKDCGLISRNFHWSKRKF